jgi:hypothetical protein
MMNIGRGDAVQNKDINYNKMRKLFIMLLLAAFTLSAGVPLLEAAPAKARHAQLAKGKSAKKSKAKKKNHKKQKKMKKRH